MLTFPNAKINLGLRITRRRPDGYHDIRSLMVPIAWHDILEAVPSDTGCHSLTVTGRHVDCPPEKNLVMKALRALEEAIGHTLPPTALYLRKIIPDGAGLGGGSADAAFTVKALDRLHGLSLTESRMAAIAAQVGADCPFFISDRTAAVSGTGTTLTPAPEAEEALRRERLILVVAKPSEGVSTREAYAGVTPRQAEGEPAPDEIVATLPPEEWAAAGLTNDFEPSVMARCPAIAAAKERMLHLGAAYAAMTGSGSAVIGLFRPDSDIMSAQLRQEFDGCDTFASPLLG